MRLVHFSDWHWEFQKLPEADIYVCTGDMFSNYPKRRERRGGPGKWYDRDGQESWHIDPKHERKRQLEAANLLAANGGFAQYLVSSDAPIVCVRGNHDFIDLAPLFQGLDVTEIVGNEVHEILGLRFTGHRGIPSIGGSWNDEVDPGELLDRVRSMPAADVYLTHYPPEGMLDSGWLGHRGWGLRGMLAVMFGRIELRGVHCFGHIHEQGGTTQFEGDFMWSNAATGYNEIELTDDGPRDVTRL